MINKMLFASCLLLLTSCQAATDWLTDLAMELGTLGAEGEWNNRVVERIMEKHIEQDERAIATLEDKMQQKSEGFLSKVYKGARYLELKAARSSKQYHEKVKKSLMEFPENKQYRMKFLDQLATLYKNIQDKESLAQSYAKATTLSDKISLRAQIVTKQTIIGARKAYIKSSFLLS